jgi:hypothetical protein
MLIPKPLTEEDIIWKKRAMALALWAVKRVSPEQKQLADGLFHLFVFVLMKETGCDYLTAVKEAPYVIPEDAAKEKNPFGPAVNLLSVVNEYESTRDCAKQIKKKSKTRSAMLRAFKENFPYVPDGRLREYPFMESSKIAFDSLARKYKLNVSGEAVKKYIAKLRPQMKTINNYWQNLERRQLEKRYHDIKSVREMLQKAADIK